MPRIAPELSPAAVRRLMDKPGLHAVGGVAGLLLQVSRGKSSQIRRSWILRVVIGAKRRDIGLGSYPSVTVGIARDRAREAREQIRQSVDPIEERRRARAELITAQASMTFSGCAEAYIRAHESTWRNAKHRQQWRNTLDTYVYPTVGDLPVAAVDVGLVMKILEPIWHDKPETASRVRGRIETILDWAKARGHRSKESENPARWRGHLNQLLPKKTKVRKPRNQPAMPYRDVPAFMARLRARDSTSAMALEFTILGAVRTGETINATRDEIDLAGKTWTIPSSRMKADRSHRVPLTERMIEILESLPQVRDNPHLFAGARGKGLSNMALLEVLRGMDGNGYTVHGFRSSFRDWCAECTNFPRELAEAALAHVLKDKTEASYQRGDLFAKRRKLMDAWARYVATPRPVTGQVIAVHAA